VFVRSLSTITPELLEMSSQNFQGIILESKGRPSSKMVIVECTSGEKTSRAALQRHLSNRYAMRVSGSDSYALLFLYLFVFAVSCILSKSSDL